MNLPYFRQTQTESDASLASRQGILYLRQLQDENNRLNNPQLQVRRTLFKQVLLIVGSVLAFEIVLLSTLAWLMLQAENATRRAEQSRRIVIEGTSAINLINDCTSSLIAYETFKSPTMERRYSDTVNRAMAQIATLQNIPVTSPLDAREIKDISQRTGEILSILQEAKEVIEKPKVGSYVRLNAIFVGELEPAAHDLMQTIQSLVNRHRHLQVVAEAAQSSKTYIKYLVAAGLILNIAISLVIVASFSNGLVRRISLILDNMGRFERSEQLLPGVAGNDEVSVLDQRFRHLVDALNKAMQNQRSIFQNAPVGIVALGPDLLIQSINPQGEQLFGFASSEIIGSPLSTLVADLTAEDLHADMLYDSKPMKAREVICQRKDRTAFPAELSASAFHGENGDGIVTSFMDLTERKEVERLKKELLAIVTHDIKTPLGSIQGSLELLESGRLGELTEDMHSVIGVSRQEARRLIALASDLLDVAKMEAGKFVLDKANVQLSELAQRAVSAVSYAASQKTINIVNHIANCRLHVDADRIVQVFVNILSNAIKYSGTATTITMTSELAAEQVKVLIQDQGPGIPEDKIGKMFERFEQVSAKESKMGTGLGLAICKFIVESHGGKVGVTSKQACGSCFWFTLPLSATDK
jgi:PAS domain S-box-containing protein